MSMKFAQNRNRGYAKSRILNIAWNIQLGYAYAAMIQRNVTGRHSRGVKTIYVILNNYGMECRNLQDNLLRDVSLVALLSLYLPKLF